MIDLHHHGKKVAEISEDEIWQIGIRRWMEILQAQHRTMVFVYEEDSTPSRPRLGHSHGGDKGTTQHPSHPSMMEG